MKKPKFKKGDKVVFFNYKDSPNFGHTFTIEKVLIGTNIVTYNIGPNKTGFNHSHWLEDCFRKATKLDKVLE